MTSLLVIGVLGRTHGTAGELHFRPFHAGSNLIEAVADLVVAGEARHVRSIRPIPGGHLVAFAGVDDREAAAKLTLCEVAVDRGRLPPLSPGEFYVEDLVGCEAVAEDGRVLGVVRSTFWNGAQDVMTIAGQEEHLVPVVPEHVLSFDAAARRIIVRWEVAS